MTTHNELMAEAVQNYAMAHHYLGKLKVTLDQLSAVQSGIAQASRPPVRCVREWQDWLSDNGPTIKGDIQEATGIKFTERGTPYTVEWTSALAEAADDRFAPNTLMKINTKPDGRGAPPKVYFLWSQRFDVHPLFDVGPIKPDNYEEPTAADYAEDIGEIEYESHGLGTDVEKSLSQPTRFATMEEWDDGWSTTFDALVASESKPTDDVKQKMRDTLPEGAEPNAAIAIALREAKLRARNPQTLLGVVHPPVVSPHALSDGPWEEPPLDWTNLTDST